MKGLGAEKEKVGAQQARLRKKTTRAHSCFRLGNLAGAEQMRSQAGAARKLQSTRLGHTSEAPQCSLILRLYPSSHPALLRFFAALSLRFTSASIAIAAKTIKTPPHCPAVNE